MNRSKRGTYKSDLYYELVILDLQDQHKVLVITETVSTNNEVFKFVLIKKDAKDPSAKSGSYDNKETIIM